MSMMHLLSAGKSLIGLNDPGKRYRQPDPRAMPKFGSNQKFFQAKAGAKAQTGEVTNPGKVRGDNRGATATLPKQIEQAANPSPGLTEMPLRSGGLTPASACHGPIPRQRSEKPRTVPWLAKISWWLPVGKAAGRRPAGARLAPPPVQGELSLENVKVLRNDLSDVDLEVVAVKPKPAETRREVATAVSAGRAKPWARVATLLGAGQT
jgi:hypothetical protein